MSDYPKVLVISNNCFSKSGSNGRTLSTFFKGWPIDKIAQFFIHSENPDSPVCKNYYRVTDSEAIRAFYKGESVGGKINTDTNVKNNNTSPKNKSRKRLEKNPLTSILRNIIWNSNRWQNNNFTNWVDEFKPEVILLQSGDSTFMLRLATNLAISRKIPLVIYNSESYYFKDKNFMTGSGITKFFYPMYLKAYHKQFNKTISYASYSIYICDELKDLYDRKFNKPSTVIMTGTEIPPKHSNTNNKIPVISYLGNLGVGRHEPLIEIGEALQQINPSYKLSIYGKLPNNDIKEAFENCGGIDYRGFVSYDEVVKVMHESDLLVHAESFLDFYLWDSKYAFSTKIADSLSSGTCFFVYAPGEMAITKYLKENNIACVVSSKEKLMNRLENVIKDRNLREFYTSKALAIVNKNHEINTNANKFQKLINQVVEKESKT